jgi:polyisoprenoid-binding protein YceI
MKKLLSTLLAAVPALALGATSTWSIDASHSTTTFAVRHLVISTVRGEFTKTTGAVTIDDKDVAKSAVEATIDANTISTREVKRDEHLKSPDFLDTAKYPTITFKSTKVEKAGKDKLKVAGDLTLHGVTKPVVLDIATSPEVKGMFGETRRGFSATTKISRKAFGVAFDKVVEAGPVVGDEVTVVLDIEAVKDQPKAAQN